MGLFDGEAEPGKNLRKFLDRIVDLTKKTFVDKWIYVLEQVGETPDTSGDGFHTHVLFNYKSMFFYSEVQKRCRTHFASFATSDHTVHMTPHILAHVEDKVNYMLGDKLDKKLGKVSMDRIWRTSILGKHGIIEDFYTNSFNFFIEDGKAKRHEEANRSFDDKGGDKSPKKHKRSETP